MRAVLGKILPVGSARRWVLSRLYRNPFSSWPALFRSVRASWSLCRRVSGLPVRLGRGQRLLVRRAPTAKVRMRGVLIVEGWSGGAGRSSVTLAEGCEFTLEGDFTIGQNVHLSVFKGGALLLGGARDTAGSGITCDSRILAASSISIGADTIIAWGVVITDSDWHEIDGKVHVKPVMVGDHVWIAHDCSILKGASIPSGCIVAAKSLVGKAYDEPCALLAGVPAKIIRRNVEWAR